MRTKHVMNNNQTLSKPNHTLKQSNQINPSHTQNNPNVFKTHNQANQVNQVKQVN